MTKLIITLLIKSYARVSFLLCTAENCISFPMPGNIDTFFKIVLPRKTAKPFHSHKNSDPCLLGAKEEVAGCCMKWV